MAGEFDRQVEQDPARGYVTDVFHFEKYVVPGACAVGILALFPWYVLGGGRLGSWDLGTVAILALVVGHLLESLKVYQWSWWVRSNFRDFNGNVSGLFSPLNDGRPLGKEETERAENIVFALMESAERSEFAWNLVRWQKMIVLAAITCVASMQWLMFALFAYLSETNRNVFRSDFQLVVFRPDCAPKYSLFSEIGMAVISFVCALAIHRYGLQRQKKNNDIYYQVIYRHRQRIFEMLQRGHGATPKAAAESAR